MGKMLLWVLILLGLCGSVSASADKFFARIEQDALKQLERGKPQQQVEAAVTLGSKHAARTVPVLTRHLAADDVALRLASAEALWGYAAEAAESLEPARSALLAALNDADAGVAMNAAGALAAMSVPESQMSDARRRVLDAGVGGYVGFLAARGLVGIEPAVSVWPALSAYYLDAVEQEERGGSDHNVEIAEQALQKLAATGDRELLPGLDRTLSASPPATPFLLKLMHQFDPPPPRWTERLLEFTDAAYPDQRETAWDLLGSQTGPDDVVLWAPKAARLLRDAEQGEWVLDALSEAAGFSLIGLSEIAQLAEDAAEHEERRIQAINLLGRAGEANRDENRPDVIQAAAPLWSRVCTPIYRTHSVDALLRACEDHVASVLSEQARAELYADALRSNAAIDAKLLLLPRIEGMWSAGAPAAPALRAARMHSDARVVSAAESALDRVEPAWRERDQRGGATPPARPAVAEAPRTSVERTPGAKGVDGVALYTALAQGDAAAVKKLVTANNVHLPVHYPGMQAEQTPIMVAINYCGIPQAAAGLPAIIEYLLGLGANPDVTNHAGDNLLDMAKYSCTPEVMALLGR